MWKALFLATGICLSVLGAECLVIERCYLKPKAQTTAQSTAPSALLGSPTPPPQRREIVPPEWAPWSLMAAGAVVILYSITLPKRIGG